MRIQPDADIFAELIACAGDCHMPNKIPALFRQMADSYQVFSLLTFAAAFFLFSPLTQLRCNPTLLCSKRQYARTGSAASGAELSIAGMR